MTSKKLRSVLLAAACGGLLFAAITMVIVVGYYYIVDLLYLRPLVALPAYLVAQLTGLGPPPNPKAGLVFDLSCTLANTALGALLFALAGAFWQFVLKNPYGKSERLRSVLKAAAWGGGAFAAITVAALVGFHFWPAGFFGLILLLGVPTTLLISPTGFQGLGPNAVAEEVLIIYLSFLVVNAVIGAVVFAVAGAFWQFVLKNPYEK